VVGQLAAGDLHLAASVALGVVTHMTAKH